MMITSLRTTSSLFKTAIVLLLGASVVLGPSMNKMILEGGGIIVVTDSATGHQNIAQSPEHPTNDADNNNTDTTFYATHPGAFFTHLYQTDEYKNNTEIMTPRYLRNRLRQHDLVLKARPQFFSCNAPKTGCTGFYFFYAFVNHGKWWNVSQVKSNPSLIHIWLGQERAKAGKHGFPKATDQELVHYERTLEHYVVARNPYVRFLSSYFDWLARTRRTTNYTESNVPFAKFTEIFVQRKLSALDPTCPMNHIDTVSKFCGVGKRNFTVLRVEEQALWMPEFIQRHGLQESMENYTALSGNILFRTGLHADSRLRDHAASIAGREAWPTDIFASVHHNGAAQKLAKYYTPEIARMVTKVQEADFVNFGYPLWDGRAESFRLV